MELNAYDYHLPEELIAQAPAGSRDGSRMMVVQRDTGTCLIGTFRDYPDYFARGDAVVINDSRVFPARLIGRKETGGMVEILLLARQGMDGMRDETWEALLRPAKRVREGTAILFAPGCRAQVLQRLSEKRWLLGFSTDVPFDDFLARDGRAPLPPYIKRRGDQRRSRIDQER
ncbi:MAG: S-adenosylmethionine:tRNA ribosyltransferase-isomerase, partial [Thermodesulfobacteriota bacterium]